MPVTDAAAWRAQWIEPSQHDAVVERWSLLDWIRGGGPGTPPEERLRAPRLIRQRFDVGAGLLAATLRATAHGVYEARLNGAPADDQVLAPGVDSYEHRLSVQTYDVTALLHEGENVLGVVLADGWWAGRIGITGSSAQWGTRLAALWQLELEYDDGAREVVGSSEGARSSTGGWVYADLFVGECFDRRADPAGWDRPGFDDARWHPVSAVEVGFETLVPVAGEPVRRVIELPAASIVYSPDATIVDFGQVIAGRVRLRVRDTTPGQRITLEHTEALAADGSWFANITGINTEQTDVFIAAGGDDEWEPSFTFHGFRFARVRGLSMPLDLDDIEAVVIASDLAYTGDFACSDDRLTQLHRNVVWSQRGNFVSIPTDCPQREKVGWAGEAQIFAAAAANNADVLTFLSRWLDNLRVDQLPDGRVPIFSPRSPFDIEAAATAQGIGAIVAAAGWSDAIAIVPWTLYERYGDRRVLDDNVDAMLRWVEYQRVAAAELPASLQGAELSDDRRARQALLYNAGLHFGDWLAPSTLEGKPLHEALTVAPALTGELVASMFQAQTLTLAARICDVLGRDEASDLADRARAVREAFAAEYFDDTGDLPVRLQGVYVLALAFDMVPEPLRESAAARLVELVHERGDRLDTGFLSVPYLLDVLWDAGYRDLARTLLWQDRMPSWLYEVDHGATTMWEWWDAVAPDGTARPVSLNHYAFGCVDDWLYRRIAGLQCTSPGWATAMIEPDLDVGLEWARAHVGTPHGRLAVSWQRAGDKASVTVEVPDGVSAELVVGGERRAVSPGESTHQFVL